MTNLTLRNIKGTALSWDEGDANFANLDSDSPWIVADGRIHYTGNVGIGPRSSNPTYHLDFGDGDSATNEATIGTSDADLHVHVDGARKFKVTTNSQERLTLTTEGKFGIGETDPQYELDVGGYANVSNTLYANNVEANSFADGTLSISSGSITNAKRIVSTTQIDFTQLYDRSTGYKVDHIDSVLAPERSGLPTSQVVYDLAVTTQNALDSATGILQNYLNGLQDSVDFLLTLETLPAGTNNQTLRHNGDSWEATSALLVKDTGNVGIGIDPTNTLDINGGVTIQRDAILHWQNSARNTTYGGIKSSASKFSITWDDDDKVFVEATGFVGIGKVTPQSMLDVAGSAIFDGDIDAAGTITAGSKFVKSGGTAAQYLKANGSTSTDADIVAGRVANSFTVQGTSFNGSAAKSVTFSGGSGISISGTTINNSAPDRTVSISGGGATSVSGSYPNFSISSSDTTYTAGSGIQITGTSIINTAQGAVYSGGNGISLSGTSFAMSGSFTGSFTATGDIVAFSDVAYKEDINPIVGALEKVSQIGGYTFKRKDDDSRKYTGVIAQEIQKVLPEAIHSSEEGLAVAYGNLTGLLIEAVKELSEKVKELESRK
jgi:hypothetical protein